VDGFRRLLRRGKVLMLALSDAGQSEVQNLHVTSAGDKNIAGFQVPVGDAFAPPELPRTLTDQLKPGGKLLAPIGDRTSAQALIFVEKAADGKITSRPVLPVQFVSMVKSSDR
jgi:hypothetical protein